MGWHWHCHEKNHKSETTLLNKKCCEQEMFIIVLFTIFIKNIFWNFNRCQDILNKKNETGYILYYEPLGGKIIINQKSHAWIKHASTRIITSLSVDNFYLKIFPKFSTIVKKFLKNWKCVFFPIKWASCRRKKI